MDTLRYENLLHEQLEQHFEIPSNTVPVALDVAAKTNGVELSVAGQSIMLTVAGARALAYRLRQAADSVHRSDGKTRRTRRGRR